VARAIDAILKAPDVSDGMRSAGRQFAKEELSWSKIARRVSDGYQEMISVRSNRAEVSSGWQDSATTKRALTDDVGDSAS